MAKSTHADVQTQEEDPGTEAERTSKQMYSSYSNILGLFSLSSVCSIHTIVTVV